MDMKWNMNQARVLNLGFLDFSLFSYTMLHVIFDDQNGISGQNSKEKSCRSMSLGYTMNISPQKDK